MQPRSTVLSIMVCGSPPAMPREVCRPRRNRCGFSLNWFTAGRPSTFMTGVLMPNWPKFVGVRGNSLIGYSVKYMRHLGWLGVIAVLGCLGAPATGQRSYAEIDQAFARMYNTDFRGAHDHLDRYVTADPSDPLGYAVRASAYLFSELDRLGILESEFFADDKRIIEKKRLKPDPAIRDKFLEAVNDAQTHGAKLLAANANDQNALFSMAITQGVVMDYTALVEKRQLSSLGSARRANDYAQQLLKVNPQYYDAYLTTGLSEYLLGSLPFYVKWFVHFDGVNGDKSTGIDNLKLVARSGHYLRPFAKILLAICYMREKQPRESQKLLVELSSEFPANPLLKKELAKISDDLAHEQR